jgi:hypothetical protein
MNRWTKLLVAAPALGGLLLAGLPARGGETGAEKKDAEHAQKIEKRMDERREKANADQKRSVKEQVTTGADQGADAARVGGAKTAGTWHKGTHQARRAAHRAATEASEATK